MDLYFAGPEAYTILEGLFKIMTIKLDIKLNIYLEWKKSQLIKNLQKLTNTTIFYAENNIFNKLIHVMLLW